MSGSAKHVPLRRCVACRRPLTKDDLVRLVRGSDGWVVDDTRRAGGRGTWVCSLCISTSDDRVTRRALARAFHQQTDEVVALLASRTVHSAAPLAHATRHGGTHG
ncbi:YlxR family protein [soil metagenome]|nr:YlxR family protein [Trueperaceae bacterium]